MPSPNDALIVLTTVEHVADGERLARLLVEGGLAACVQILPLMTSIYTWQGSIQQTTEQLLLIKTKWDVYPQLEAVLKQNHPYDTPEIIGLPVAAGSSEYLNWLFAGSKIQP